MNGHSASSESYYDQLDGFQASDRARNALVTEVLRKYEALQLKYAETLSDYNNEVESRRMWQSKANQNESALTQFKQASGSNSFVLVVIDGDGAPFADYLYARGRDGGSDAAYQLHAEIKNHLKATYPDAAVDDWNVVVQVVLNLQGIAAKLHSCGLVMNPNEVFAFARAFGSAQPLFSFIDVGQGKERADHKIRETLRVFLPNAQCKHVFFGPTHDNGYLVVLENYRRNYASRLTLIETRPAEPGFMALGFPMVRFPSVFRSADLPAKTVASTNGYTPTPSPLPPAVQPPTRSISVPKPAISANSAPFVPRSASPAPSSDSASSGAGTWAAVGAKGASNGKTINIASKKSAPRRCVLLNVHDERLDSELPRTDAGAEKRFAEQIKTGKKYCNSHHLTGVCMLPFLHAG
ncbi:uncharacterized protein LTR77_002592 [Saxophila tyrrhenica]|uniref:DUF7923 domain-containing protein n=1 Tax=Saxophila tyrrhenica TaxID=1690608 RepID=A0AAV9PNU4_9PEZI|nr:hypothetical protein LTR77_002592 [Saxophila tyrrhenica]